MPIETILPAKTIPGALVTCEPSASLHHAAKLMKKRNVGCVVVTENEIPIGVITDRDICVRALANEPAISLADPVRLIMSTPIKTINLKSGLQDAIRMMKEAQIRRLPVVDSTGKAVGILTLSDLYTLISKEIGDLNSVITVESGFEFGKMVA